MLRVLTLNTQLRSTLMEAGEDTLNSSDAPERALALAAAITTRASLYDVIAFNEVFDETARDTLVEKLKGTYPHFIRKMPAKPTLSNVGEEDSGLMIFSKLPILATKEKVYIHETGFDAGALKGMLLARLSNLSLIVTHTQAGNKKSEVKARAGQLTELAKFVEEEILEAAFPVLVVGDLNIEGNQMLRFGDAGQQAKLAEWNEKFDAGQPNPPFFASALKDCWCFEFLPADPPKLTRWLTDAGLTHTNKRLDYVLKSTPVFALLPQLALHRMRVAYELFNHATNGGKSSDHIGLVTHLQVANGGVSPRLALEFQVSSALNPDHSKNPGPLFEANGSCQNDGAQWLRLDAAGSWAFGLAASDPSARYTVFGINDFSTPMPNYKKEQLKLPLRIGDLTFQKYVLPLGPLYILIDAKIRNKQFNYRLYAYRFVGTNPDEALVLIDHGAPEKIAFKSGAPHSVKIPGVPVDTTDGIWFRIDPVKLTSGKAYKGKVRVEGKVAGGAALKLLRGGEPMTLVAQKAKGPLPIDFELETKGGERLYLVVQRQDTQFKAAELAVRYTSPVSLFHGVSQGIPGGGAMLIECTDETNPEVLESDDISIEVTVDGKHVKTITNGQIGDFDDGDVKPLDPFFNSPLAFVSGVTLKIIEGDDVSANETGTITFAPLTDNQFSAYNLELATQFGGGEYFIHANLSRFKPT